MQIGTRWRANAPVPANLPEALRDAVAAADVAPDGWWTLTWLEGRPIAEHDDGLVLAAHADGTVAAAEDPADAAELDHLGEGPDDEDDGELFP